jgi:hypothetical protein
MTWIINADMLAMMHAINFALLRSNCRAALTAHEGAGT